MGINHFDYARSLNNIGCVFKDMGSYEKALKYFQDCLVIQEKICGKSHPDYSTILNNIGSIFQNMENY